MESHERHAELPSERGHVALEQAIGHDFRDLSLLKTALTHSSFVAENAEFDSYERLEFLGDAVLELLTTEIIFGLMPGAPEGEMTKVRATVVDVRTLADVGRALGCGPAMYLGIGETRSGGADRDSLLSDVVEAVLGAIFVDAGIEAARRFVVFHWRERIVSAIDSRDVTDSRSLLQEQLARTGRTVSFSYQRTGPDHAAIFVARAVVDDMIVGTGRGSSKKSAAIAASADALERNTSM